MNERDLSFFKSVPIKERVKFQFRWEMYNALNHTQFGSVNSSGIWAYSAATGGPIGPQLSTVFGQVNSTRTPKVMVGSMRLSL
jgi:hypothetical protein